jgi:hypothetical protein
VLAGVVKAAMRDWAQGSSPKNFPINKLIVSNVYSCGSFFMKK